MVRFVSQVGIMLAPCQHRAPPDAYSRRALNESAGTLAAPSVQKCSLFPVRHLAFPKWETWRQLLAVTSREQGVPYDIAQEKTNGAADGWGKARTLHAAPSTEPTAEGRIVPSRLLSSRQSTTGSSIKTVHNCTVSGSVTISEQAPLLTLAGVTS
jgi:hypothetical protein